MKYQKTVNDLSKIIVDRFSEKGMGSLYLAGTILSKDRVPDSDIDFFIFVDKKFNIKKEEGEINKFFDKNKKKLCGGLECRLRAIGLDEFSGKVKRGNMAIWLGVRSFALVFPFWKHLWGEKIDFKKKIKPYSLRYRKNKAIERVEYAIGEFKRGNDFFIKGFAKAVLRLAGTESEIIFKKKYEHSYAEIAKRFSSNKKHIAHDTMKFRKKGISNKQFLEFLPRVENYVKYMRKVR